MTMRLRITLRLEALRHPKNLAAKIFAISNCHLRFENLTIVKNLNFNGLSKFNDHNLKT